MENLDKVVPLTGRRYGEEIKQRAYEMWRTDPDMTMTELEERLRAVGSIVPADTLSDWREKRGWVGKFQAELLSLGPEFARAHVAGLRVGAPDAIAVLSKIMRDEDLPAHVRLKAAHIIIAENRHLLLKQIELERPAKEGQIIDISLSDEELLALENEARQPGATY